ncbi:MAG TPA: hypothetical protein DGH68_09835, partial [Bacteroidetes bacterium]|nr:hypothetical protein [Bacteroidota bacterium]
MVFIALLVLVLEFSVVSGQPQYYNYSNVGSGNNSFPFNVAAGKEVQYLFLANDFNQPTPCPAGQQITTLYLFMVGAGTGTFTNLTIKLGQTDSTFLPVGVMYTGPMDTVYYRASGSLTSTATSWMSITLDRPYPYNPTRSLIVDVAQCGVAALTGMTVRNNTQAIPPYKRTYINNSGSCVYVYSGQDGSVLNCGFDVVPAQPQYCNYDTTANPNSFPLNQPSGKMCQYLILPGDFNRPSPAPSGNITSFSLRMAAALGPYTYSAFYILMGQTTLTSLPTSSFYTSAMDTVFKRDLLTL